MEENKQNRLKEIDERLKSLEEHAVMWGKAGGRGGKMMMMAYTEIEELRLEQEDLINGTNKLQIHKLEKEINRLKSLKEYLSLYSFLTH